MLFEETRPPRRRGLPHRSRVVSGLLRERVTILVVGHAGIATGFARVLHALLGHVAGRYRIHHFAPNLVDRPPAARWPIHPNPHAVDVYGLRALAALMESIRPRIVLILQDPWVIPVYLPVLHPFRSQVAIVAYCPVDGRIRHPAALSWLREVTTLVLYNAFGRSVIQACVEALGRADPSFRAPPIKVIPHGTSTDLFYPYPDGDSGRPVSHRQRLARRALSREIPVSEEAFVVLNASRNQIRKRIDLTVQGFALFARDKPPEVYLYLHMGAREIGWDVRALARAAGIEGRLLLTTHRPNHPSVPGPRLNLIYNACDVGINTACAEGWGLVSFEHAATGAAQIVPRHGACEELWSGAALMIEPESTQPLGRFLEARVVSPEGVAHALEILYRDPAYRSEMAMAAYRRATHPAYRWENIAEQWIALFDELMERGL